MTTPYDDHAAEIKAILDTVLVDEDLAQEVRDYRSITWDVSPLVIVSANGSWERPGDLADEYDYVLHTIVRFDGETEAEEAEHALNAIEHVIRVAFGAKGAYQSHEPHWQSVEFYQRSTRSPSPLGPGTRYMEQYLRIVP